MGYWSPRLVQYNFNRVSASGTGRGLGASRKASSGPFIEEGTYQHNSILAKSAYGCPIVDLGLKIDYNSQSSIPITFCVFGLKTTLSTLKSPWTKVTTSST